MYTPTHCSILVQSRSGGNAQPLGGIPFYAEVVTPEPAPRLPVELDARFDDHIEQQLLRLDPAAANAATRNRIRVALRDALSRWLTPEVREHLAADADLTSRLLATTLQVAQTIGGETLANLPDQALTQALDGGLREAAAALGLETIPEPVATTAKTAYPLGLLATDHAGYLSFDLTRLTQDVYDSLVQSIALRRQNPAVALDTTIWLYALARADMRFDALSQGRLAQDVILTKLEFDAPLASPSLAREVGMLSMQNPSLTDWRLSPASFATNPALLVGGDGCEDLLPANIATQEYRFYQVVRLTDAVLPVPAALQGTVRLGLIHEYRLAWYPLGHSLGQILYSLPLAPGESVNLAVIDWTRRDDAQRAEHTTLDEQIVHNEHRDRVIGETVNTALNEYQHGSSFMGGIAGSAGASGSSGVVGGAAGISGSIGGSTASSSGSRDVAGNTVQKISDTIAQVSAATRELQSTVVVHSVQAEKEAIETRTVVNYNHSHTLTVLYYEILRHFRVATELVRTSPALLVRFDLQDFEDASHQPTPFLLENRALLRAGLLDAKYAAGFDALERIQARGLASGASAPAPAPVPVPAPAVPLGPSFVYFTITVHTGGIADGAVALFAALYDGAVQIANLVTTNLNPPDGNPLKLESHGAFEDGDKDYVMFAVTEDKQPRTWQQIRAMRFGFAGVDRERKFSVRKITVEASDLNGLKATLIDWNAPDYIFVNDTDLLLETVHPAPLPPPAQPPAEEVSDQVLLTELLNHLKSHKAYYNRIVWLNEDPYVRADRFDAIAWDNLTLLDHLENRPLETIGAWMAFPSSDSNLAAVVSDLLSADASAVRAEFDERLVTLPARGVFADAKLGHCNASEEIDNTRFWDWQQSPIPHFAPEIAPVQPVTPQAQQQNLQSTPFPQSLVNIVNPPAAPDPTGLTAAMNVLATPNIFRDMSGQAQVADLLKRLSDNSVGIAEASNIARSIQNQQSNSPGNTGNVGGTGSGSTGSPSGIGGPRATPTQPSAVNRDLQDFQNVLTRARDAGLMTPEQSQSLYTKAAYNASGPAQVGSGGVPNFIDPDAFKFAAGNDTANSMKSGCVKIVFRYGTAFVPPMLFEVCVEVFAPMVTSDGSKISVRQAQLDSAQAATKTAFSIIALLDLDALSPSEVPTTFVTMYRVALKDFKMGYTVQRCNCATAPKTGVTNI